MFDFVQPKYGDREKPGCCGMCGFLRGADPQCSICTYVPAPPSASEHYDERPENEGLNVPDIALMTIRFGATAFRHYREGSDTERRELLRLSSVRDWPKNEHGYYACCCCGYHVLDDAPQSFDVCPVCYWQDAGFDWNMYWWNFAENGLSLEDGRRNFEETGVSNRTSTKCVRSPLPDELPRHDWSADDRPYFRPPEDEVGQ